MKLNKSFVYIFTSIIIMLLAFVNNAFAWERYYDPCRKYIPFVWAYSDAVYGLDYPYWYNLGQLMAESDCKWLRSSGDGWGSYGPAQITPAFENRYLCRIGLCDWRVNMDDYFYGYLLLMKRYLFETNKLCWTGPTIQKRMWAWFQVYNTGPGGVVNYAISRAGVCKWKPAKEHCHGINVCVWRTRYGCRQWRNACDINFDYSLNIFRYAQRWAQPHFKTTWQFW